MGEPLEAKQDTAVEAKYENEVEAKEGIASEAKLDTPIEAKIEGKKDIETCDGENEEEDLMRPTAGHIISPADRQVEDHPTVAEQNSADLLVSSANVEPAAALRAPVAGQAHTTHAIHGSQYLVHH